MKGLNERHLCLTAIVARAMVENRERFYTAMGFDTSEVKVEAAQLCQAKGMVWAQSAVTSYTTHSDRIMLRKLAAFWFSVGRFIN